jgi:hypothetical protein
MRCVVDAGETESGVLRFMSPPQPARGEARGALTDQKSCLVERGTDNGHVPSAPRLSGDDVRGGEHDCPAECDHESDNSIAEVLILASPNHVLNVAHHRVYALTSLMHASLVPPLELPDSGD